MSFEGISKETFAIANVVIYVAILIGVFVNRQRRLHIRIMWSCFIADMLMVLVIELARKAIKQSGETALHMTERPLLAFHIFVSVMTLILWFVQLRAGPRLAAAIDNAGSAGTGALTSVIQPLRAKHRMAALVFLGFRSTNLVTSFFV